MMVMANTGMDYLKMLGSGTKEVRGSFLTPFIYSKMVLESSSSLLLQPYMSNTKTFSKCMFT